MKGYIYVLRCPKSNEVRYVGKCVNLLARRRQHISEARLHGLQNHKCRWIRSLLRDGFKPIIEADRIIEEDDDWKAIEIERVAFYKASGCNLTNATNGGDEAGILTEEGRKNLSERASRIFGTPEGRARQAEIMRQLCSNPEWKAKRDAAAKATRATPEYKERMSARAKAAWQTPGYKERFSESRKRLYETTDLREKLSRANKASQSSEDVRLAKSQKAKAAWANPEIRERQLAAMADARSRAA